LIANMGGYVDRSSAPDPEDVQRRSDPSFKSSAEQRTARPEDMIKLGSALDSINLCHPQFRFLSTR
jgi:hypothetical protein